MFEEMKVGLVLSGGGAKGAYQVGVLKALMESGTRVDMLAGASIGALNGAVLASAPSLKVGVEHLEKLWTTMAEDSPISMRIPGYLTLLCAAGLRMNGLAAFDMVAKIAQMAARHMRTPFALEMMKQFNSGVLCDKPLQSLMDEYLDMAALARGLPLYVSVFESVGGFTDLGRVLSAELGVKDSPPSKFFHVQSLPVSEQKEALLASAAIPLLFESREVNGATYSDGGQGDWSNVQGNTPITPLLEAGCNMVIVTHLTDGSLFSRHDFPEANVLEIRPQSPIARDAGFLGGAKDLLGFDSTRIPSWIEQGYRDALHCIERVMKPLATRTALRASESALRESESQNEFSDSTLEEAMSQLC